MPDVTWNTVLDALEFIPAAHGAACLVHRRALGSVIGRASGADACLAYAVENLPALERAARDKIMRDGLASGARFHLTSRDVRAAVSALRVGAGEATEEEPGEDTQQRP